jgi:hypothetical protein
MAQPMLPAPTDRACLAAVRYLWKYCRRRVHSGAWRSTQSRCLCSTQFLSEWIGCRGTSGDAEAGRTVARNGAEQLGRKDDGFMRRSAELDVPKHLARRLPRVLFQSSDWSDCSTSASRWCLLTTSPGGWHQTEIAWSLQEISPPTFALMVHFRRVFWL